MQVHMQQYMCYDMEVGENRVRVFYGTEKREGEKLEIYIGDIGPCIRTIRPVTSCTSVTCLRTMRVISYDSRTFYPFFCLFYSYCIHSN